MTPALPSLGEVSEAVSAVLTAFLDARARELAGEGPSLPVLVEELRAVVESGGKRVRPWICCWGAATTGSPIAGPILAAASALELVHTFALIQDDVMDGSAVRRGRAATHVTMGLSPALLVSDLALIWADQLLTEAAFSGPRLAAGFRVFNALRTEVTLGQYLDVTATADEARALEVDRLKTASYTVLRPMQLGMALGGADPAALARVPAYAEPAGIAFQLRDDVLGAFGDEATTGKPAGDDLLNQKPTWLWARALRLAGSPPDGVDARRAWLVDSGARAQCEQLISELEGRALLAVDDLTADPGLRAQLVAVTRALVDREA